MVDIDRLTKGRVFGDRVLIKKFSKPTKARGLYIPEAYAKQGKKSGTIWWGAVAAFGLDSYSAEAHGLSVGDIVGIEPMGNHYAEIVATDGNTYVWVPDEHLALADQGTAAAWQSGTLDPKSSLEVRVLGARALLRPHPVEEKRGGVYMPTSAQSKSTMATVVLAGPGDVRGDEVEPWNAPCVGNDVLFVSESEAAAAIEIVEPALVVVRRDDLIAEFTQEEAYVGTR